MSNEPMGDKASPSAAEDMLADLGVGGAQAAQLRALLGEIAGLAHEVPEPSDNVRALLGGAIPLRARRRTAIVAAAVGALALGGVSAAAATNRLPDPVQEVAADATRGVVPHPVKPTIPRKREVPPAKEDAPGRDDKPKNAKAPKPHNTSAPGQIQKLTKPDPATEPAHPADPGSHGRAHNDDAGSGSSRGNSD